MAKQGDSEQLFVEDLFIVDYDDKQQKVIYRVPEQVWKNLDALSEADSNHPVVAKLIPLLRSEVVLASVPAKNHDKGYYLTDLTALAINKD